MSYCYPPLPLRIALGNKNFSLLRNVHGDDNLTLPEKEQSCLLAPMAYTMLKTEELVIYNVERIRRTQADKHQVINQIAGVEWVHGPIDQHRDDCAQFLGWSWSKLKSLLKDVYQEFKFFNVTTQMD